jgi:hypothetical protein
MTNGSSTGLTTVRELLSRIAATSGDVAEPELSGAALGDAIARAEAAASPALAGRPLPRSFKEVAATIGLVDVPATSAGLTDIALSTEWIGKTFDSGEVMALAIDAEVDVCRSDRSAIAGLSFVDNPGDLPAYALLCLPDYRTSDAECLWCYRGWDASEGGGIRLAPLGVDFWEVLAALLVGVPNALFTPAKTAKRAAATFKKLGAEDAVIAHAALNRIEDLLRHAERIDVALALPEGNEPKTLAASVKKLRERIGQARASIPNAHQKLPFGRGGSELSVDIIKPTVAAKPKPPSTHATIDAGDLEGVRTILAGGADPNARDKYGNTPLHRALAARQAIEFIKLLCEAGADPNAAFHDAVSNGNADIVRALLAHGADASRQSDNGWTPLALAEMSAPQLVPLLREHGAS